VYPDVYAIVYTSVTHVKVLLAIIAEYLAKSGAEVKHIE
jgi:hypothetical protein